MPVNIKSPTTIELKILATTVGTAASTFVSTPGTAVLKVDSVIAANIDGTNAVDYTLRVSDGTATHAVCSTVSVPADASLVVVDRTWPVYLPEGWRLEHLASAANDLHVTGSYEEIS
jgi:hypothetical protein